MIKMKIFVYSYSPTSIGINYNFDGYVITTPEQKVNFINCGIAKKLIYVSEKIDFFHVKLICDRIIKSQHNKITEIFTLQEDDIEWVDLLNHYYFDTSPYPNLAFFKDKYYMRTILYKEIRQPKCLPVWNKVSYDNVPKVGLIKPRRSEAAQGISFYSTKREFDNATKNITITDGFIAEEKVDYDVMFTCDGIWNKNEIVEFYSHQDSNKLSDYKVNKYTILYTNENYWNDQRLISLLKHKTSIVLSKLTQNKGTIPFHMEWFYNKTSQKLTFCEVGARFGGWHIPYLVEQAFGKNYSNDYWHIKKNLTTYKGVEVVLKPECVSAALGIYYGNYSLPSNISSLLGSHFKCFQTLRTNQYISTGNSDLAALILFSEPSVDKVYSTVNKVISKLNIK